MGHRMQKNLHPMKPLVTGVPYIDLGDSSEDRNSSVRRCNSYILFVLALNLNILAVKTKMLYFCSAEGFGDMIFTIVIKEFLT